MVSGGFGEEASACELEEPFLENCAEVDKMHNVSIKSLPETTEKE